MGGDDCHSFNFRRDNCRLMVEKGWQIAGKKNEEGNNARCLDALDRFVRGTANLKEIFNCTYV